MTGKNTVEVEYRPRLLVLHPMSWSQAISLAVTFYSENAWKFCVHPGDQKRFRRRSIKDFVARFNGKLRIRIGHYTGVR